MKWWTRIRAYLANQEHRCVYCSGPVDDCSFYQVQDLRHQVNVLTDELIDTGLHNAELQRELNVSGDVSIVYNRYGYGELRAAVSVIDAVELLRGEWTIIIHVKDPVAIVVV